MGAISRRIKWWFQDAEGARGCVATRLMIPEVAVKFPGTEQER